MALSTYDELKASVADFLNRSDLTSVIPDFIKMALRGGRSTSPLVTKSNQGSEPVSSLPTWLLPAASKELTSLPTL